VQMSMEDHKARARRQGNRLGIFLVVLGLVLFVIGDANASWLNPPIWATVTKAVGGGLLVCGYPPGVEPV
jgi:hypothetical protein